MIADAVTETFRIKTVLVLSPLPPDLTDLCASLLADLRDDPELHLFTLHLNFHAEEILMQRQRCDVQGSWSVSAFIKLTSHIHHGVLFNTS